MSAAPFQARPIAAARQPFSLGLSALVAGTAVFLTDMDLDLLGYGLIGLAILLLLHTGLSVNCTDGIVADGMAASHRSPPSGGTSSIGT